MKTRLCLKYFWNDCRRATSDKACKIATKPNFYDYQSRRAWMSCKCFDKEASSYTGTAMVFDAVFKKQLLAKLLDKPIISKFE